jgi:glycosyltransferase involved in cell wall biosynthesis
VRIACVSTSTVPSRTANSIQLVKACAALVAVGEEVAIWVPGKAPSGGRAEVNEFYGVQTPLDIRWLRSLRRLRGYDFCARACLAGKLWGADLFYVWPYQAVALCSTLGWPVLMEVHDRPHGRMGPALFRRALRGSGLRRLVVTTEALRDWLEREFGRPLDPPLALVAPNAAEGADPPDRLSPADWRSLLGLPEVFTAGYTGHLYAGRGLELLLELARRLPEAQFLWVGGEDPAVESWRGRLAQENIENVRLMGFRPPARVAELQRACDVLLMPYERSIAVSSGGDTAAFASPMKAFEYMAAGRAILSSDLPVIREVLHEGNAVLLPPDDPPSWEAALRRLMKYPERRARLGEQARRESERNTWPERARRALQGLSLG